MNAPVQQAAFTRKIELLRRRLPELYALMDPCELCPRRCMVRRMQGEIGECGIADKLIVSSIGPHHGNESFISGTRGSGNIFLAGCNLHCVYCQNWTISREREGRVFTPRELAQAMLRLQEMRTHSIDLVSPTHVAPLLAEGFLLALEQGLRLPLIYNTGGYDSLEVLELLDGIVDVYLPDMKYGDAEVAKKYSGIEDYPAHNQAAVKEMYRQVGPLVLNEEGVAARGVVVRHLVLPNDLGSCEKIFTFLDEQIPGPVHVNVMAQYRPCYRAAHYPDINRRITAAEYERAIQIAASKRSLVLVD